jgi:predicted XRE-type DNA-binding protein
MFKSRGNVYRDIGFSDEEARDLVSRSQLMLEAKRKIKQLRLTRRQSAILLQVAPERFRDLLRGRISIFSRDELVRLLARLASRRSDDFSLD